MAPVIVAKDLYKCYPGFPPVLRGVNIDVEPGEMVAIMGPSGCGKSTMLHVLGMLHAPDSGTLEIMDQNVLDLNNEGTAAFRRGNMGFVMQASNLFEHSTVFENVEFPLIYENVPPQERWERVIRALELVRLSGRVHYRSNRLSGGEQQRVAIARAMVNNPRILLADEPTGALDARTSRVIMENFRNLCHKGGVAMVMVTHDPKMAEYCDSIYTLEDGQLRCQKHEPPKLELDAAQNFLKPPQPLVSGALVAWHFPDKHEPGILELARRMHQLNLLGRIYALTASNIMEGSGNYSLPLAVRHMNIPEKIASFFAARRSPEAEKLQTAPAHSPWRKLRRLAALGRGMRLAKWVEEDGTSFLYAAGSREVAGASWVAATLRKLPFAFAVRAEEIPKIGPDVSMRAHAAAFVTCSTKAMADAFVKAVPDLDPAKILLLPAIPLFTNLEEEPEAGMPPQPGQPTRILVLADSLESTTFKQLLSAAAKLKTLNFLLKIGTTRTVGPRLKAFMAGLRKKCVFFRPGADRLAEAFRESDIFFTAPPTGPGQDLTMPWQVSEAMAMGKAIITTGITPGLASALVAEENCILADNEKKLEEALENLISKPELREGLGKKAREAVSKYLNISGASAELLARVQKAVA